MAIFINCTPHKICFKMEDGSFSCIEPDKNPFRLEADQKEVGYIDGIKIFHTRLKKTKLPKEEEGVYYIVSSLVLDKYKNRRKDLLAPARLIRDENGVVIGCEGLTR